MDLNQVGFMGKRYRGVEPMREAHQHLDLELNYVFKGGVTYLHRGQMRTLEEGRLALFWGAVPHCLIKVEPLSDFGWITVSLATLRKSGVPPDFLKYIIEGGWVVAPAGNEGRFSVASWLDEIACNADQSLRGLQYELLGCLWWLSQHTRASNPEPSNLSTGGAIEVMASFMAEHYLEPVTVEQIADAARLHPNYAMTMFRHHCGITICNYLVNLRLTHAQQLLVLGNQKILDIAMESGFNTLSSFYDNFTRNLRMTPSQYRKSHSLWHSSGGLYEGKKTI